MRVRLFCFLMMFLAAAAPAAAADKLAFGAVPAWVVPASVPAPAASRADAPIQMLLLDQQVLLGRGKVTTFTHFAVKIQNAQGLSSGNLSIPWRPEFDTLTIHSLQLRRDGKVIDVLGAGQTFSVLRREAKLESAMLDGVLTANIQPEGLQVGDILDLQMSAETADPTLGGNVQQVVAAWNDVDLARGHVSALWPADLPLRLRFAGDLPKAKIAKRNGLNAIDFTVDNLKPMIAPMGAPARFKVGRAFELSSFQSWADVGAVIAPLYDRASAIPLKGPLRDEVERIRNSSADPLRRAEAALALVEDRVRYVALNLGEAGMIPASAEETWSRRFGDCKGKTALLLGMLHEFGIEAIPVAVNTSDGDAVADRLPMAALFNHVLVRARIGGREYWLDGTRIGDRSLANLTVPDFGYGLEIIRAGGKLARLVVPPLERPSEDIAIRLDASAGLQVPAPAEIEIIYRGDAARGLQAILAQLPDGLRDQGLREIWKQKYDFIDVASTTTAFDPVTGELRLKMKGSARMDWSSNYYETDGTGLGATPDWDRAAGPLRDAPVAVAYPWYSRVSETTILPKGFPRSPASSAPDVDVTLAGIHYRRRSSYKDNVFSVTAEQRSLVPEISFAQATADEKALKELGKNILYLRVPDNYRPSEGDLAAMLATKLTTASQFIKRGHALLEAGRLDEALADFDRAIALEPKDDIALANRGITLAWKKDYAGAERSLGSAEAINPRNAIVRRARGLIAAQKGDQATAIAEFTRSLEFDAGNSFALGHRAQMHGRSGDEDRALADSAEALKKKPNWGELRLLRANIYVRRGRNDLAQAEAEALVTASSTDQNSQVTAAAIFTRIGKRAEAAAAYDRALAIKPSAFVYINRSMHWPMKDVAARTSDIDAALKLEPDHRDALALKADLLEEKGDWTGSAALLSKALADAPESQLFVRRGIALYKLGRTAEAEKDFKAAVAAEPGARIWNNLCWAKATAGIALESGLEDCNQALRLAPGNRSYLDSRGLVLLRLGKIDAAIADYDQALADGPFSSALLGRSLALAKKGDSARSASDRSAAEKMDPDVVERFRGYGLSF